MKYMKNYEILLKMMFMNNYYTDFMFQEAMMCETCSPPILSFMISNFLLVFKLSQKFVEIYVYMFWFWNLFINSNKMTDI